MHHLAFHLKRFGGFASKPIWASSPRQCQASPLPPSASFDEFFSIQFGSRWNILSTMLASPTNHIALINIFNTASVDDIFQDILSSSPEWISDNYLPLIPKEYSMKNGSHNAYPPPPLVHSCEHQKSLLAWYWMDPASLLPPLALSIDPNKDEKVLDMCAAPGGKSLILSQLLYNTPSHRGDTDENSQTTANESTTAPSHQHSIPLLICNEIDYKRRQRLLKVLDQYTPDDILKHIHVTGHDGTKWSTLCSKDHTLFDKILLDAPCSSDRHVVQQKKNLLAVTPADWNLKRCNHIAKDQFKLLVSALECLKMGGRVVYSTCSMAEMQNDGVIERVLQRVSAATGVDGLMPAVKVVSHQTFDDAAVTHAAACSDTIATHGRNCPHAAACSDTIATHGRNCGEGGRDGLITVADLERFGAERTQHGWLIVPDATSSRAGPLYFAVLEKTGDVPDIRKREKVNKYPRKLY